jgi:hypothetical protein
MTVPILALNELLVSSETFEENGQTLVKTLNTVEDMLGFLEALESVALPCKQARHRVMSKLAEFKLGLFMLTIFRSQRYHYIELFIPQMYSPVSSLDEFCNYFGMYTIGVFGPLMGLSNSMVYKQLDKVL